MPDGDAADTVLAIDAAAEAFGEWSRATAYQRADFLHRAYRLMMDQLNDL